MIFVQSFCATRYQPNGCRIQRLLQGEITFNYIEREKKIGELCKIIYFKYREVITKL